ncbi:MAG TPA: chemotaxis protein CheB [Capsulimonadaceae bacterium]|jgi:two-component system chemotaxis response regulator CheB
MLHIRIRTLVVEDVPRVRAAIKRILNSDTDIEAVGSPSEYLVEEQRIARIAPDVVTLPTAASSMENYAAIRESLQRLSIPVVIMPTAPDWEGIATGANRSVPGAPYLRFSLPPYPAGSFEAIVIDKVKTAAGAKGRLRMVDTSIPSVPPPADKPVAPPGVPSRVLIAIGASTGGTQAIADVLRAFPRDCPPTLIVQHMPAGFTASFARSLDKSTGIIVKEAEDGDEVVRGRALIAPGGFHMRAVKEGGTLRVSITSDDAVNRHRPSVDVLFNSLAAIPGLKISAALLTGMGADGAIGLNRLHASGARTIAQDENSCVVFGMPREAIKLNAADIVLPLDHIGAELIAMTNRGWDRSYASVTE